jgi:glycosyltransferase involved in cell wall biosynthesis
MGQPDKVLITGGREVGGLTSFAEALGEGFKELGIPSEIISPRRIWSHWQALHNSRVLKILSTTAVFSAPIARRAICMAHGMPGAAYQGWPVFLGNLASYKLSNLCSGTQLVAVSQYTALHLSGLFNIKISGVILNPMKDLYLDEYQIESPERHGITYVGRLVSSKNLHRLLPAVRMLMDENPGLRTYIIGHGPQSQLLKKLVDGDPRFEFKVGLSDFEVRDYLRRTKVFISGHGAEGLGIIYLEALSQGCAVAMPASGGGLELALDEVGTRVHLLPLSFNPREMLQVLRKALKSPCNPVSLGAYTPRNVAVAYLALDSRFSAAGKCLQGLSEQPVATS